MDLLTGLFVVINLALYIGSGYLFFQFIMFIKNTYANRLTSGKLGLWEIVSMAAGIVILGGMLVYGPYYLASGIRSGWNNFMPVMQELSAQIVGDMQGMLGGNLPVNVTTYGTGEINPITGHPYNDPNAGGGVGIVPTPIMPEMRPTAVYVAPPTPTLAPTFDPNGWKPGDAVPTPEG